MLKKLVTAGVILLTSSMSYAMCGAPYLAASLGMKINTTSGGSASAGAPVNARVANGLLAIGYGVTMLPCWYLGAEIFAAQDAGIDNNDFGSSVMTSANYGISVLPGFWFGDRTLGYVRLGAQRTQFSQVSAHSTGGQAGFGVQVNLMENWNMRVEYTYSAYGTVAGMTDTQSDQANIGIVYRFE